jgi:DNA-binding Lrp family transcriptional regulator
MQLTERDREIIRLVYQHRFLRSPQIVALVGGSGQQVLRRLQLLYHHGYLERPRMQLDYYHQGGSRHIVYGLGSKSAAFLNKDLGVAFQQLPWGEKNGRVQRMFLEHALLVSDVMVALELACRGRGNVRLIDEPELRSVIRQTPKPCQWRVNAENRSKLCIIPDRVFALEFPNQKDEPERVLFFLEADRGTMPVIRRTLSQSSFYRKLLGYEATWAQSIHRTRFGFHRFRVMTVTTIPGRVQSLIEACSQFKSGKGLFLFADRTVLEKPDLFSSIWTSGHNGQSTNLLN